MLILFGVLCPSYITFILKPWNIKIWYNQDFSCLLRRIKRKPIDYWEYNIPLNRSWQPGAHGTVFPSAGQQCYNEYLICSLFVFFGFGKKIVFEWQISLNLWQISSHNELFPPVILPICINTDFFFFNETLILHIMYIPFCVSLREMGIYINAHRRKK